MTSRGRSWKPVAAATGSHDVRRWLGHLDGHDRRPVRDRPGQEPFGPVDDAQPDATRAEGIGRDRHGTQRAGDERDTHHAHQEAPEAAGGVVGRSRHGLDS